MRSKVRPGFESQFHYCMFDLGNVLHFSESQFSHLKNGANSASLLASTRGVNGMMCVVGSTVFGNKY